MAGRRPWDPLARSEIRIEPSERAPISRSLLPPPLRDRRAPHTYMHTRASAGWDVNGSDSGEPRWARARAVAEGDTYGRHVRVSWARAPETSDAGDGTASNARDLLFFQVAWECPHPRQRAIARLRFVRACAGSRKAVPIAGHRTRKSNTPSPALTMTYRVTSARGDALA